MDPYGHQARGGSGSAPAACGRRLRRGLALRELRGAAGLAQTDLLALDLASVPRHESGSTQRLPQRLVIGHQRARDAVPDRARLAGRAAAGDRRPHVELAFERARDERLADDHPRRLASEELLERAAVDRDLSAARPKEYPRRGSLASAGAVIGFGSHRDPRAPTVWAAAPGADARRRERPSAYAAYGDRGDSSATCPSRQARAPAPEPVAAASRAIPTSGSPRSRYGDSRSCP